MEEGGFKSGKLNSEYLFSDRKEREGKERKEKLLHFSFFFGYLSFVGSLVRRFVR